MFFFVVFTSDLNFISFSSIPHHLYNYYFLFLE
nr:MAG TPA: hypothetical protein [Caudoviricetes sp.]